MTLKNSLFITFSLFTALILSACSSSGGDASLLSLKDSGMISPQEAMSYDWEEINIEGGDVSHVYKFTNEGADDLIIKKAVTSCMCTTAQITVDGNKSPTFGMHESPDWGFAVKPGQEFEVNVIFNPMAHGPNAVGPIKRSVFLETSSVPNGEYAKPRPDMGNAVITEITAQGDVLYKEDYDKLEPKSAFFLPETEFDFGVVKQSAGIISHDFEFGYTGDEPIKVTALPTSCACTSAEISQGELKKGDTAVVTVEFDPNLHEEPNGRFFKTITLLTEPELDEQPEIKIWVEMDLDLGPGAYKLQEAHDDSDSHEKGVSYHNLTVEKFDGMLANKDFFLLDVHIPEQEHIDGTDAFIPYDQIEANLSELPEDKNKKIVVYCRSGGMSPEASATLTELGYKNVFNLQGGKDGYTELNK